MSLLARSRVIKGCGAVLALALAFVAYDPNPVSYWFAFIAGLVFFGLLFERFRYKQLADSRPGPGWVATDERFIDPESNRPVTVFYNPSNGERLYVADPNVPRRLSGAQSQHDPET
jgi:hypothetical protein